MKKKRIEFTEYIAPDGKHYNLDNGRDKFLMSSSGEGMPPIEYITQRGPMQHGSTIIDYRLGSRTIQYLFRKLGCDRQGYWEQRAGLLDILRPNRQALGQMKLGSLVRRLPGNYTRQIDVFIQQGPGFQAVDPEDSDNFNYNEVLQFIAPDPTFYDPTQVCNTVTFVYDEQLVFPITFPIMFGQRLLATKVIHYTGSWMTYPTITVTGPFAGVIITNVTTNEYIRLNYNAAFGEVITISLQYGNKTVTSSTGANLMGSISTDSAIATFHLAPDPEASNGNNTITVMGVAALGGGTAATLAYYNRYIGI